MKIAVGIWLIVVFVAVIGWVMNIVKFVGMLDNEVTGMWIARLIGIPLAFLGAILGWIG